MPILRPGLVACALLSAGSAWANLPAQKATVRTELRSGDGVEQARIKTWRLRGGTRITTEILLRNGKRFGHSRTVERVNQSKHTVGRADGVAFRVSSGFLGGAHLSWRTSDSGDGYQSAINPGRDGYVRFSGPIMGDRMMKLPAKR